MALSSPNEELFFTPTAELMPNPIGGVSQGAVIAAPHDRHGDKARDHELAATAGVQHHRSVTVEYNGSNDADDEFFDCAADEPASEITIKTSTSNSASVDSRTWETNEQDQQACKKKDFKARTCLPAPMSSRGVFSVFAILKQCIGKELSKITMPVVLNEPISFLQRIVEYLEYAYLLEKASLCADEVERMQYVAAFAVSACASNWDRLSKPFNPLLGETYELDRPELGFRIACEQVSHHPPVSAFHATSSNYRFYGAIYPKLSFWGKSVEATPKGVVTVELLRHGETYTWENVNCFVHNIIFGKIWLEHHGVMEVVNHNTGLRAELTFKKGALLSRDVHKLDGYIIDARKNKLKFLYGSWTDALFAADISLWESFLKQREKGQNNNNSSSLLSPAVAVTPAVVAGDTAEESDASPATTLLRNSSSFDLHVPGQTLLWQVDQRPDNSSEYYNFTRFSMMLNEMTEDLQQRLPRTDSRRRPDVRELENGFPDAAAAYKESLEEKQRNTRKTMKKSKEEWQPRWYTHGTHPVTGKECWLFNNRYWERNWNDCPDIF